MGFRHLAQVGARWAAQAHQPTYRPFKSRMSQMLVDGLEISGPSGLAVHSPSPPAHVSPIQKLDVANVGGWASDIRPKWARCGQPKPTSPLIAHSKVGCRKCWLMGFRHQAQVGTMWVAQAHHPTYRPFKSRMSQM